MEVCGWRCCFAETKLLASLARLCALLLERERKEPWTLGPCCLFWRWLLRPLSTELKDDIMGSLRSMRPLRRLEFWEVTAALACDMSGSDCVIMTSLWLCVTRESEFSSSWREFPKQETLENDVCLFSWMVCMGVWRRPPAEDPKMVLLNPPVLLLTVWDEEELVGDVVLLEPKLNAEDPWTTCTCVVMLSNRSTIRLSASLRFIVPVKSASLGSSAGHVLEFEEDDEGGERLLGLE